MFRQMWKHWFVGILVLSLVFVGWSLWGEQNRHPQQTKAAVMHLQVTWLGLIYKDDTIFEFTRLDGSKGTVTGAQIRQTPAFRQSWLALRGRMWTYIIKGTILSTGLMIPVLILFGRAGYKMRQSRSLRGASLTKPEKLDKLTSKTWRKRKADKAARYRLAGVTFPYGGERRHTMIVGSTGTGKTVAISDLLAQIRARGDKVIVYDKMGSFIPYFYDESRDFILNPLDARSHDWDMFGEVRHEREWDTIAKAIIPTVKDTADPFWTTAARQLFAAGSAALWKTGDGSIPLILDLLLQPEYKELAKRMAGLVEQALLDERNDKMTTSIRAILSTSMKPLTYMPETSRPFSIRNWLEDPKEDSALFLSSGGWDHESRMGLLATQMEVAIVSMISGGRDSDRNIWFIIDELPTMEQIPSLKSALAESRQFGGCFVIGTQVVSELREIYGRNNAETISGNCNTRLVLGTPDMATAQFCADSLGRSQTVHISKSISYGMEPNRDGEARSEKDQISNIVLPSEVMELPQLNGYLRMAGGFPVARVELETTDWPRIARKFVPAGVPDPKTGEIYDTSKPPVPARPTPPEDMDEPDERAPASLVNGTGAPDARVEPRLLAGSDEIPPQDPNEDDIGGDNESGESDPPTWSGHSPSGPPGYLADIPPERPSGGAQPAKSPGGEKKRRKKKSPAAPMGQANGVLHADNPEHQAALDFQAPTDTGQISDSRLPGQAEVNGAHGASDDMLSGTEDRKQDEAASKDERAAAPEQIAPEPVSQESHQSEEFSAALAGEAQSDLEECADPDAEPLTRMGGR